MNCLSTRKGLIPISELNHPNNTALNVFISFPLLFSNQKEKNQGYLLYHRGRKRFYVYQPDWFLMTGRMVFYYIFLSRSCFRRTRWISNKKRENRAQIKQTQSSRRSPLSHQTSRKVVAKIG